MPTEITITAYTYAELSDKAKQHAIATYGEPAHNWWEEVYAMHREYGKVFGFDIDRIFWNGFSSQGDGASWDGHVDMKRYFELQLEKAEGVEITRLTALVSLVEQRCCSRYPKIIQAGYYSHEGTMHFESDLSCTWDDGEKILQGPLQGADVATLAGMYCSEGMLQAIEEEALEAARDYARKIYRALETEYDWLTSEEYFIEGCEANDFKFDEDGNLI